VRIFVSAMVSMVPSGTEQLRRFAHEVVPMLAPVNRNPVA
jgi:hypothetical protein